MREHKTFAKKLSRALGRGEFGLAKNLEESKPVYRIDHIIKERLVSKFVDESLKKNTTKRKEDTKFLSFFPCIDTQLSMIH